MAALGLMDLHSADTPANVPRTESKPVTLPEETAQDLLIHKVEPEYPAIAKAARISGIVEVTAIISKTGEIHDLHAQCGPEGLIEAALAAIQLWKYRPYLLNGKPVEVQTTIRVTFALGNKKKPKFSKGSCHVE